VTSFRGQKVKIDTVTKNRKSAISSEREGLRTSFEDCLSDALQKLMYSLLLHYYYYYYYYYGVKTKQNVKQLLQSYGQALKQEDCFSGVLGDDCGASAVLLLLLLLFILGIQMEYDDLHHRYKW